MNDVQKLTDLNKKLKEESRELADPIGHAQITCGNFKLDGLLLKPVKINLDDGLMTCRILLDGYASQTIADVQMNLSTLNGSLKFKNIDHKYNHTYVEEADKLNNKMILSAYGREFIFYKIYLTKVGSHSNLFRVVSQCAVQDLGQFDEFIKEDANGRPKRKCLPGRREK